MPISHSPQPTSQRNFVHIAHTQSDSNLPSLTYDAQFMDTTTPSSKRQRANTPLTLCANNDDLKEITHMILSFQKEQSSILKTLVSDVQEIKSSNIQQFSILNQLISDIDQFKQKTCEIVESKSVLDNEIKIVNKNFKHIQLQIESLHRDGYGYSNKIQYLEDKILGIERCCRPSIIEKNTPQNTETSEDLISIIMKMGEVDVGGKSSDIHDAYEWPALPNMTTQANWKIEKNKILSMPIEEKRNQYKAQDYVILDKIDPWCKYVVLNKGIESKKHNLDDLNEFKKIKLNPAMNKQLSEKVSIYKGDITKIEVDAIVNAANSQLRAGGGVDGAIHRAAGPLLQEENNTLGGCPTGEAKITGGYNLPAKYVIHTVGPQDGSASKLQSCYEKCFAIQSATHLKSIAFPCISTGIYGFPNRLAAHIALKCARKALEADPELNRVIFCTFLPIDVDIYETLMQMYFPVHDWNYNDGASVSE